MIMAFSQAKANVQCPSNPWRIQHNALFARLDSFLERCHDILEMGLTIQQYNRCVIAKPVLVISHVLSWLPILCRFDSLKTIEIGGTKGKTLSTSVAQISTDFQSAVDVLKDVGAGITDLNNKSFETSFYSFRNKTKELDRRLASVIVQGFDDAPSITSKFRMLDTFDCLLQRYGHDCTSVVGSLLDQTIHAVACVAHIRHIHASLDIPHSAP